MKQIIYVALVCVVKDHSEAAIEMLVYAVLGLYAIYKTKL